MDRWERLLPAEKGRHCKLDGEEQRCSPMGSHRPSDNEKEEGSVHERNFTPLHVPLWKHSVDCSATLLNSRRIVPNCAHPKRIVFPPPLHFGKHPDVEPVIHHSFEFQGKKQGGSSSRSFVQRLNPGPAQDLVPHVVYDDAGEVPGRLPSDLEFESKFESGNLQRSVRIGQLQYNLILRPDLNTGGCQWYYFMVRNMQPGEPYRFNIVNLYKDKSMYRRGLLPLLWSEKDAMNNSVGWRRAGRIIGYDENRAAKHKGGGYHYTLSFQIEFPWDDDCCFLAMCYPYTYTDLHNFLGQLCSAEQSSEFLQRSQLCETPCGYSCEMLTITASASAAVVSARKTFVITGRVHPGESNSSWIIEGMVKFLTGSSSVAQALREAFVFYIVPMINPGGVIHGYYRVSNMGHDLNRQWIDPKEATQATIFHCKKLIQSLTLQRRLLMFCDVHGHSSKPNTFMYGCNSAAFGTSLFGQMDMHRQGFRREQAFPKRFSELCPAMSFKDCKFQVDKAKESTGRGVVFKEFGIVHSYTLEASFLGLETPRDESVSEDGAPFYTHFNPTHLQDIGAQFIFAIADYVASGTSGWEVASEHRKALSAALRAHYAAAELLHAPTSDAAAPQAAEESCEASSGDRTSSPPPRASCTSARSPASRRPPRPPPSSHPPRDAPLADAASTPESSASPLRRSREKPRRADSERLFAHRWAEGDPRVVGSSSLDKDAARPLSAAAPPATAVLANARRRGLSAKSPLPSAVKGTAVPPVRLGRPASSSALDGGREEAADASPVKARSPVTRPLATRRAKSVATIRAQDLRDELGGTWMRVMPAPASTPRGRETPRSAVVEREVVVYGGRGRLKLGRPATALLPAGARTIERAASLRGARKSLPQTQSPAAAEPLAVEGEQRGHEEAREQSGGGGSGCQWQASGRPRIRPASANLSVKPERLRLSRGMSS